MDIVELSNTADKLARIINQKNQELEEVKRNYNEKLQQINNYIDVIKREQSSNESLGEDEPIEDSELVEVISKKLHCQNCDREIWDLEKSSDFVLIPKRNIKYLLSKSSTPDQSISVASSHTPNSTVPSDPYSSRRTGQAASNNKSKKTCSYCHKTGHSRARCFERLSKPS